MSKELRIGRLAAASLVGLVVTGIAPWVHAQEPLSVSVELSEQHVSTGDSLTMEVNVVSRVDGQIELALPELEGLVELSRSKSEGTSISWTGRGQQITREVTFTLELEAQVAGKHTIPPVKARAAGHTAASRPIVVEVSKAGGDDVPASKADPSRVEPPGPGEQRLFLRYKVDRASAFVGEQILLDLDVYATPSLNFAIEENAPPPTLDGFWREVVDQPQRLTRRVESIGGKSYQVYRMWRMALFPLEPGEKTIPEVQLTFAVNRSIFGGGQRDRRKPPKITLDVKPLPTEGRPAGFSAGNVGAYQLAATVDHQTVPAGKALVLSVVASGRGNVKNLRLPELPPIPGFRTFPPTVSDSVTVDAGGVSGEKRAQILLMPERGGRLEIPAIELVTFNPAEARWDRLQTSSIRVAVEGDPSALAPAQTLPPSIDGSGVPNAAAPREASGPLAKDELRPIRFRSTLEKPSPPPWASAPFAAGLLAPPLLYALLRLAEAMAHRGRRETPESRRRAALRHAHARLARAREASERGDGEAAHHELLEALLDFTREKVGVSFRGMTTEEMRSALEARGAPPPLIERFTAEVDASNYARFVPGATDAEAVKAALSRFESLLGALEVWEVTP